MLKECGGSESRLKKTRTIDNLSLFYIRGLMWSTTITGETL